VNVAALVAGVSSEAPAAAGAHEVDTLGWDTVFAIRVGDANRAIVDHHTSPAGFDYADAASMLRCSGTFGDWQITSGGDGGNIRLRLPVTDVRGAYPGAAGPVDFRHPALTATIQIRLHFLPQPDADSAAAVVPHDLVPLTTSTGPADPVVSLVTVDWTGGDPSPGVLRYLIEGAVVGWCNDHLDQFAHVFATVDLNQYVATGDFAFCKPTYLSYAYAETENPDEAVIGVLCMTGGRPPGQNVQQVSPAIIPPGTRAGFALSRQRLLADMILPTLPLAWTNAALSQFALGTDGRSVVLVDGQSVQLPDVSHDGSTYTPYLEGFTLTISDAVIQVDARTEVDLGLGVTGWCDSTHRYTIALGTGASGQQTLVYSSVGDPDETHGTSESSTTTIVLVVIGLLVTLILAILTDGVALIVAGIVAGVLLGVAGVTPDIIAAVDGDQAPGIDLLTFNATHPITWPDSKDFTLHTAVLNGALQLGGDPGFT